MGGVTEYRMLAGAPFVLSLSKEACRRMPVEGSLSKDGRRCPVEALGILKPYGRIAKRQRWVAPELLANVYES